MPPSKRAELQFSGSLGDGLRRARLSAGFGFRETCRLVELDISSLYRIEHGEFTPTIPTMRKLLTLYQANLNIGPDGLFVTWLQDPEEGE